MWSIAFGEKRRLKRQMSPLDEISATRICAKPTGQFGEIYFIAFKVVKFSVLCFLVDSIKQRKLQFRAIG